MCDAATLAGLKGGDDIHDHLAPVYQTVRTVVRALPADTTLIGFAGAPWTVATYMIAGRATPDQAAAHRMMAENPPLFDAVIERLTHATIAYLDMQVQAGAEAVKLFDSWAGSLGPQMFERYAVAPVARIISALKARKTGADCVALDDGVSPEWAAAHVQVDGCVQGNLAPHHMVRGGRALVDAVRHTRRAFSGGAHIFNLGHGITPDADPAHVAQMIETVREVA